jgi:protein-L-isoaspartate(D-aspartate) O-methyltransferase
VAIDESRTLFSGVPGLLAGLMDSLGLKRGAQVAHIGTGNGYYTAVMAVTVGSSGRVLGVEVDARLAATAVANLAPWKHAQVINGDGTSLAGGPFDAILVNAGVTHVLPHWLDNLAPGGRMIVPLTATMGGPMGPAMANIGKGIIAMITKTAETNAFDARFVTFVAIYSAIGLRDEAVNAKIGAAMAKMPYPMLKKFRLDPHEPSASCWMHDEHGCWVIG